MNVIETRRRFGPLPYVFGAVLGVSLGLIIISGVLFFRSSRSTEGAEALPSQARLQPVATQSIGESRRNAIVIATERVTPAVVSVTSRYRQVVRANPFRSRRLDWFSLFFGPGETYERQVSSLGSGVVISPDGFILTNDHVVRNAEEILVTLSDGTTVQAKAVEHAPDYDIALIKIDSENLAFAELGDSDDLFVGEWAIAIGQPFGQLLNDTQSTVTVGVISALHRDVKQSSNSDQVFKDMIQTDAAINPGNSGGPLINSRGEVIGINTFIFSAGNGGNLGMGFAIPINRGKWVLEEFKNYGRVRAIWVGLVVRDITPELAAGLDLKVSRGLLVREIEEGAPADKAGLKAGDLIVAVNGQKVRTRKEANHIIFGSKIGDELVFDINRRGKNKVVKLKLAERPDDRI
ncbi:MAG: trypsin-like peptidase domain-containing protein [Candidatus Krumholzibacteria bacterium]